MIANRLGCLLVHVLLLTACASSDEKANKLFVEASAQVQEGLALQDTDIAAAADRFQAAADRVADIVRKYPGSVLAVRITEGAAQLGPFGIAQFRDTVAPEMVQRASAVGGLLGAAAFAMRAEETSISRVSALLAIASAYERIGESDSADAYVSRAANDVRSPGLYNLAGGRMEALAKIARWLAAAGRRSASDSTLRELRIFIDTMSDGGNRVFGSRQLLMATAQTKGGRADQLDCQRTLRYAATATGNFAPLAVTDAASAYVELCESLHASAIVEAMPNSPGRDDVASALAIHLARAGMPDAALQVAGRISARDKADAALEWVAGQHFRNRDWQGAREIALVIHNNASKERALGAIRAAEKGLDLEASPLLQAFPSTDEESVALAAVKRLAGAGQVDEARLRAASIRNELDQYEAGRAIAIALASSGHITEALQIAESFNKDYQQGLTRSEIAMALVERGQLGEAIEIASTQAHDPSGAKVVAAVARAHLAAGRLSNALTAGRIIPEGSWTDSILTGLAHDIAARGFVVEALSFAQGKHQESGVVAIIADPTIDVSLSAALDAIAALRGPRYRAEALAALATRFKGEAVKAKPDTRRRLGRILRVTM